jgi:hypothetical protein
MGPKGRIAGTSIRRVMQPVSSPFRYPIVLLVLAFTAVPAFAAGDEPDQPQHVPGSDVGELEHHDPCRGEVGDDAARLDKLRGGLFTGVCSTSRWFDGLFGDARDYSESYSDTYGRAGAALGWDKMDDVGLDGHFRANIHLPALGNRFNAVIGRETEDSYITDNFDDVGFLPGSFSDDRDAEWYAGLKYNAVEGANSYFTVGAGIQLKSPLNPYVKMRYRYYTYPAENLRITIRPTAFWQNTEGFGVTLGFDTDWSVAEGSMLRWANTMTLSEETDGTLWKSRLGYYDALSELSAMRYEVAVRGETGGVQPQRSEVKVTYRRSLWRSWFFVETSGGVFWADSEEPEKRCSGCAMVGVGFEIMFGDRYDQAARAPEPGER